MLKYNDTYLGPTIQQLATSFPRPAASQFALFTTITMQLRTNYISLYFRKLRKKLRTERNYIKIKLGARIHDKGWPLSKY